MIISEPTQDAVGAEAFAQPAVIAVKSPAQSTRYRARRDVLGCAGQRTGMPEQNTRGQQKAWPGGGPLHSSVDLAGSGVPPVYTATHTLHGAIAGPSQMSILCFVTVVPVHLEV